MEYLTCIDCGRELEIWERVEFTDSDDARCESCFAKTTETREYAVELTGYALARQRRTVTARSAQEAFRIAYQTEGDHEWDYQGMEESSIEIEVKMPDGKTLNGYA